MLSTKEKIKQVSENLFFEEGIANVRLQRIADLAGISVGNLAYHYKNKETIVSAVYEDVFSDLGKILSNFMFEFGLSGFDRQFSALYQFYNRYQFTFNNLWEIERNYPAIQKDWCQFNNKILLQVRKRIDFLVEQGYFNAELHKGYYDSLAQSLVYLMNSWIPLQTLTGKKISLEAYLICLWNLLYPNFTKKGLQEYRSQIVRLTD